MWISAGVIQPHLYGSHHNGWNDPTTGREYKLLKPCTLSASGRTTMCVMNYYRGNNLALGDVICFPLMPELLRGRAPDFFADEVYSVAAWSTSLTTQGRAGLIRGKVGFPGGAHRMASHHVRG